MSKFAPARALRAALTGFALAATTSVAFADVKNYEFQLVDQAIKVGQNTITVRLVNTLTGKPVPDAVIFATRLDMGPEGMQEMTTKVTAVPGEQDGTYQFKANLSMAGGWAFSLGAKVQGETGTVEGKLELKAQK
ncbi:YtkA-like [Rhizobiales bacterium GAS191]|jgi:hypothetical protein|nr:YtkA-like [Rhizobiales bacterium GAS113]SEB91386.1 YtkA-like [Rhizobiales bacterium GAS191]SED26582.1 YtkA-like [Rhizobiales bacterium GAS188]